MPEFAEPLARLINEFKHLPGIGQKSAQRIAFHVLRASRDNAERLSQAILDVKDKLELCRICNNISESELCLYCRDSTRDQKVICVVEEPRTIGPEQLKIKSLLQRIGSGGVEEVILATSPNVEGEATAVYLSKLLKPLGLKVTRIAMGVPVGSDLEFADEVTMWKALEGRREL